MSAIEVMVPDIGDFADVEVIEVLVKAGDLIKAEQSLVTVESDKASMEIPSSTAGKLIEMKVKLGDKISQGSLLALVEATAAASSPAPVSERRDEPAAEPPKQAVAAADTPALQKEVAPAEVDARHDSSQAAGATGSSVDVTVPDIGDFDAVEVIEVLVKQGDQVVLEQSIITLESDKASMEIPSRVAGSVTEVLVRVGDKVSQGDVVARIAAMQVAPADRLGSDSAAPVPPATPPSQNTVVANVNANAPAKAATTTADGAPDRAPGDTSADPGVSSMQPKAATGSQDDNRGNAPNVQIPVSAGAEPGRDVGKPLDRLPHASPSVRQFARELGVDLRLVSGSATHQRITRDDVQAFVKNTLSGEGRGVASASVAKSGATPLSLLAWPSLEFSKFGATELLPLSRIKKISGPNLARNWAMIPHVTQFDEADITELEAFRKSTNEAIEKGGTKVTILAFVMRACVAALRKYPNFNSSLDSEGSNLILKKYCHIGFAADTPNGLVVPVIRDCDQKGIAQLASETAELAGKAREGKLSPAEMQGASFTISSLGGVGGTAFTPIINAPEVAILGLSRSEIKPHWDGSAFVPRLKLPLSLSYDHRVIDGAQAARFTTLLGQLLGDMRRVLL